MTQKYDKDMAYLSPEDKLLLAIFGRKTEEEYHKEAEKTKKEAELRNARAQYRLGTLYSGGAWSKDRPY